MFDIMFDMIKVVNVVLVKILVKRLIKINKSMFVTISMLKVASCIPELIAGLYSNC